MDKNTNVIEMRHIVKVYSNGFKANDDINLTLHKGEILALLGENGAGKSTLMNILSGLLQPTEGDILVNGKKVTVDDANKAKDLGIGMVHQHFMLAQAFTVLENIILGHEPTKGGGKLDFKKARKNILSLAKRYGFEIDPDARVSDISVSQQQRVEILKVLYRGANILIFDEPTAVLTPQEITEFIQIMKNLAKEGKSIILITHKLKEIKESADRVTVIRRGKTIGTVNVADADDEQLAEMMVGRRVIFNLKKNKPKIGKTILSVKNLKVKDPMGPLAVKGLSFDVHAGEILGVAGIDGNGQTELVDAINGLRKASSGEIDIMGKNMTNKKVREITELGVSYVPADRQRFGLILPLPLTYNLALKSYYQKPFANHGFLNETAFDKHAARLIKNFDVRTNSMHDPASDLSGGNQQKAIIARELDLNSKLVVVFQPTRGLDVGAIEAIHKQILAERDAGRAILLVSFELDEIMQLSDRIIVLHDGKISGEVDPAKTNERELGLLMTGSHLKNKEEGTNVD